MVELREKVALLTDIHANEEALEAIIKDIKYRGIKYIFSLGDLVGLGPSPKECINLAIENNIINILGNNDYYNLLPPSTYSHLQDKNSESYQNLLWTKQQLTKKQIAYLRSMPPSVDLKLNNNLIALCHFPSDSRYFPRAVWTYEIEGPNIFLKTNTKYDEKYNLDPQNKGVISSNLNPIFEGKTVNKYDAVIYGHYHFQESYLKKDGYPTNFHSLNAAGVAIEDKTFYYILEPNKKNGYVIRRLSIPYDKDKLYHKLDSMEYPKKSTFEEYIMKF
ncbi:MAG: metallophosphoesterase [Bacilli bacterium]|nr:metallophosphoesterase [Bacilli bacterium]